jgi:preprotein translocase subunit Sec63
MANYHYDEAGNMAAYFVISVLAIVLLPVTLLSLSSVSYSEHLLYTRNSAKSRSGSPEVDEWPTWIPP